MKQLARCGGQTNRCAAAAAHRAQRNEHLLLVDVVPTAHGARCQQVASEKELAQRRRQRWMQRLQSWLKLLQQEEKMVICDRHRRWMLRAGLCSIDGEGEALWCNKIIQEQM